MGVVLPDFAELHSPFMEFICGISISVVVIMVCLIVSKVLRLSPLMAHFLFGQKLGDR